MRCHALIFGTHPPTAENEAPQQASGKLADTRAFILGIRQRRWRRLRRGGGSSSTQYDDGAMSISSTCDQEAVYTAPEATRGRHGARPYLSQNAHWHLTDPCSRMLGHFFAQAVRRCPLGDRRRLITGARAQARAGNVLAKPVGHRRPGASPGWERVG